MITIVYISTYFYLWNRGLVTGLVNPLPTVKNMGHFCPISKIYSGDPKSDRSKSGFIRNPDNFEVGFLLLVPTIRNPDHFSLGRFI